MKNMNPKKRMLVLAVILTVATALLLIAYLIKENKEGDKGSLPDSSAGIVRSFTSEAASKATESSLGIFGDTTSSNELAPDEGSIGTLTIEKIGLTCAVYDSTEESITEDMKKGAAHYAGTSYWEGNIGLCAHNGNAGYSYFDKLHLLEKGDIITYEIAHGVREYKVILLAEIADTDWSYLAATEDNRITLTTCITGKLEMRLCVQAVEI